MYASKRLNSPYWYKCFIDPDVFNAYLESDLFNDEIPLESIQPTAIDPIPTQLDPPEFAYIIDEVGNFVKMEAQQVQIISNLEDIGMQTQVSEKPNLMDFQLLQQNMPTQNVEKFQYQSPQELEYVTINMGQFIDYASNPSAPSVIQHTRTLNYAPNFTPTTETCTQCSDQIPVPEPTPPAEPKPTPKVKLDICRSLAGNFPTACMYYFHGFSSFSSFEQCR